MTDLESKLADHLARIQNHAVAALEGPVRHRENHLRQVIAETQDALKDIRPMPRPEHLKPPPDGTTKH